MRVTVGNLKGGTAKTTTAIYLALGLARTGRTLLVDADPQESAIDWTRQAADWPMERVPVMAWHTDDLARRVQGVEGDYDHVVVDTSPQRADLIRQALLVTDRLVVPVAPAAIELRQLRATFTLASEVDVVSAVYASILLCRVVARTVSARETQEMLEGMDLPVMQAQTHEWQSYKNAWGTVPDGLAEYEAVLAELVEEVRADV